jgi:hypothetical protein
LYLGKFTGGSFAFNRLIDVSPISSGLNSSNLIWASWMSVASNGVFQSYSGVTQQAPILSFESDGQAGNLLSWPANGVGLELYTTTNLSDSALWQTATNQPVFSNGQWQIHLPAGSDASRFYRLQSF